MNLLLERSRLLAVRLHFAYEVLLELAWSCLLLRSGSVPLYLPQRHVCKHTCRFSMPQFHKKPNNHGTLPCPITLNLRHITAGSSSLCFFSRCLDRLLLFPQPCPLRTFIQTGIWKGASLKDANCRSLWGRNCRHLNGIWTEKTLTSKENAGEVGILMVTVMASFVFSLQTSIHAVDGRNLAPSKYPMIYIILYFPGDAGFLPWTVSTILGCFISPALIFEWHFLDHVEHPLKSPRIRW